MPRDLSELWRRGHPSVITKLNAGVLSCVKHTGLHYPKKRYISVAEEEFAILSIGSSTINVARFPAQLAFNPDEVSDSESPVEIQEAVDVEGNVNHRF